MVEILMFLCYNLSITIKKVKVMKVCVIQPHYDVDYSKSQSLFDWELDALDRCDDTMDIIVLPEAADVPALARGREAFMASVDKYAAPLLEKAAATARRCNAVLFVNVTRHTETGPRNSTVCFDRRGNVVGHYDKQHLTPGEVTKRKLDSRYTFEFSEPTVITIDGIRYGFLTCYDFYFYEAFAAIARKNVDVIIGCSHQRSDTHLSLEIMCQFLAYNTNAYVVRASVSMDENSDIGGGSMVVAPTGKILLNMKSRVGMECVDINVAEKYYKPAGFGNPPAAHYEYVEQGRRPWKYRPAGAAIVLPDAQMGYPRVCAHRGFNTIAPENSMPAFGAAVAMGAEEIELDLWYTKDGQIVSTHDAGLDRVSTGQGKVFEHTYSELLAYDFGIKYGKEFAGMRILLFEEILQKFSCQVIMNIHIKTVNNDATYDPALLQKIIDLVYKYDAQNHVYFTTGNDHLMAQLQTMAPDICRCMGGGKIENRWKIVERAMAYGCKKVQLFKGYFDQSVIDKAYANDIICNVFWSDDPQEAKQFLDMGIHTILTNDYNTIASAIK